MLSLFVGLFVGLFLASVFILVKFIHPKTYIERRINKRFSDKARSRGWFTTEESSGFVKTATRSTILVTTVLINVVIKRSGKDAVVRENAHLIQIGVNTPYGFEAHFTVNLATGDIMDAFGVVAYQFYDDCQWYVVSQPKTKGISPKSPKKSANGAAKSNGKNGAVNVAGVQMSKAEYAHAKQMGYID